jgi:hypothetical protein
MITLKGTNYTLITKMDTPEAVLAMVEAADGIRSCHYNM